MQFKPVRDRVLIKEIEGKKESDGGILLVKAESTHRGVVMAVGPDVVSVKENDVVYYEEKGCGVLELNGVKFHVARDIAEGSLICVIDEEK